MTEQEYNERLQIIEDASNTAKKELYIEFGMSKAKFKTGDIITDETTILIVDKITVGKSIGLPYPIYHGYMLTKSLIQRKDNKRDCIYGNRSLRLIEKK